MPNVTDIGGTLTVSNNKQLTKLTVPELRRLGGALSLGNNTQLVEVDAFPHLEEVDGSLDLTGSFEAVQLPKLNDVCVHILHVKTSSVNNYSSLYLYYLRFAAVLTSKRPATDSPVTKSTSSRVVLLRATRLCASPRLPIHNLELMEEKMALEEIPVVVNETVVKSIYLAQV